MPAPLLVVPLLACAPPEVDDWPGFRGPNGAGDAPAWRVPADFAAAAPAWVAELPGGGVSSPVVGGGAVFVTAANGPDRTLTRLNLTDGAVVWTRPVTVNPAGPPETPALHAKNAPAAATPALGGDCVLTLFSDGARLAAAAFDTGGKPLWRKDLGPYAGQHGHAASPAFAPPAGDGDGGGLFVVPIRTGETDGLVALAADSGKEVWRATLGEGPAAYATPVIFKRTEGGSAVLTAGAAAGLAAFDAATGTELWRTGREEFRVVASPVLTGAGEDRVAWLLSGSGGAGKRLLGADLATGEAVRDLARGLPYVPTPLRAGGRLWLWGDRGAVSVVAPKTGAVVWKTRVAGNFAASPVRVGDAVVNVSEAGAVVAINLDPPFGVRAVRPLPEAGDAAVRASAAVAGGRLLVRSGDRLVALRLVPFDPRAPRL